MSFKCGGGQAGGKGKRRDSQILGMKQEEPGGEMVPDMGWSGEQCTPITSYRSSHPLTPLLLIVALLEKQFGAAL